MHCSSFLPRLNPVTTSHCVTHPCLSMRNLRRHASTANRLCALVRPQLACNALPRVSAIPNATRQYNSGGDTTHRPGEIITKTNAHRAAEATVFGEGDPWRRASLRCAHWQSSQSCHTHDSVLSGGGCAQPKAEGHEPSKLNTHAFAPFWLKLKESFPPPSPSRAGARACASPPTRRVRWRGL